MRKLISFVVLTSVVIGTSSAWAQLLPGGTRRQERRLERQGTGAVNNTLPGGAPVQAQTPTLAQPTLAQPTVAAPVNAGLPAAGVGPAVVQPNVAAQGNVGVPAPIVGPAAIQPGVAAGVQGNEVVDQPIDDGAAAGAPMQQANPNAWRYKFHNGQWWYWLPSNQWVVWNGSAWTPYTSNTYGSNAYVNGQTFSNVQPYYGNNNRGYYGNGGYGNGYGNRGYGRYGTGYRGFGNRRGFGGGY